MSAGAFSDTKYQSNKGGIYHIRVQPETAAATIGGGSNTAPAGAVNQEVSARARGGKRQIGMIARTIALKPVGSAAPAGYKSGASLIIPVLTPDLYDAVSIGDTASYLGTPYLVAGKSPERVR